MHSGFPLWKPNRVVISFFLSHSGDRPGHWNKFHYLDNCRVSKCLVEDVQLAAELQGVDDEVLLSGGDLHQGGEAEEAPVGVVLQRSK